MHQICPSSRAFWSIISSSLFQQFTAMSSNRGRSIICKNELDVIMSDVGLNLIDPKEKNQKHKYEVMDQSDFFIEKKSVLYKK